jgi:predicted membrane-bound spermidine synthase
MVSPASSEYSPAEGRISWWLAPAFFASGFAALIYQVVWQRVLFASFGINIEAVTIVVTAFLAGLGLGSIMGGRISTRGAPVLLRTFAVVEFSIGTYGIFSVRLFRWLAEFASGMNQLGSGSLSFLLVLVPTMMMGLTLPLLVAFAVRQNANVGSSVGQLYFVNTAGSALASLAAAAFMMGALGLSKSVSVAAAINITVGLFVFAQSLRRDHA